ncbi:MAG: M13 family metallopeptidase [Kofleriaceae bacterium]|nr:M13 family metallopeptidase [Kofleriaceae bacterium]
MGVRNALWILVAAAACKPAAPSAPARQPEAAEGAAQATPTSTAQAPAAKPAPPPAEPAVPSVKMTLAEVGLEATSLDRTADPCVDFYQFACGGWLAKNPIPADRARWARFTEIDEKVQTALIGLLDADAKSTGADAVTKKLGDYYASCTDEAAIEKAGTKPLDGLLAKTTKVKDARSWMAAVVELHKVGIPVVWDTVVFGDLADSTMNITHLDPGALGLPDRDYYVEAAHKADLEAYQQHVGRMLALANVPNATTTAAADVVAVETAIAKLTKTGIEKRDPKGSNNPTDLKALGKKAKSVDWKAYFKALGFVSSAKINVTTPKLIAGLDALRKQFKPAQWSNYFTYQLLVERAFALPKAFDDEAFALRKQLSGVVEKRPRAKRCVEAVAGAMGELLGQQYVAKYFPPASKQSAVALVDALGTAMREELTSLDWMSDATKKLAVDKLEKLVRMVGYPDKWRAYDFAVSRDDFGGNELRAAAFEVKRRLVRSGKPVDRAEWYENVYRVDAFYNPQVNNTLILAGILQPPFFGADRSVAANMGGIGMVIGHELTHGFDDEGSQFDAKGNLVNWWQKDDLEKFEAKGQCVANMYDSFEAARGQFVNGKLTLGEDIADLGGVKMAFKAYKALRKGAEKPIVADGFTEDQQFFLAVGQAWCSKDRPAEVTRRLVVDPHAPPKFRVYGSLRNLPEFAQAFSCAAGTPMRPTESCSVW